MTGSPRSGTSGPAGLDMTVQQLPEAAGLKMDEPYQGMSMECQFLSVLLLLVDPTA